MLVYVSFFILSFSGGVLSHCRPPACDPEPSCPINEHYTRNNPRCIRTCANKWVPVSYDCKPFTGCACDGDLVRREADGTGPCIPSHKCPCRNDPKNPEDQLYTARADAVGYAEMSREKTVSNLDGSSFGHFNSKSSSLSSSSSSYTSVISSDCGENRCRDPNAVFKECPNPCPLTCSQPNPRPCIKKCLKAGCECAPGFLLNEVTGRCVRPRDCPGNGCRDPNAIFKKCPNPCPLTCDQPFPRPCSKACLKEGCECAPGFILDKNDMYGKCIRPNDCPVPICPKNEYYVMNDNQCQKTCGNRLLPNSDTAGACVPFTGCICEPGFVRKNDNATGPCIRERKCPPIPTQCDVNEVPTSCRIICPPQTCDSIFSSYYCLPTECEPGCDCLNGYLRNSDGDCIPSDDCFKPDPTDCGPNEVPSDCAIVCPPQSCESLFTTYLCAETNCTPGCNCIDGYLRNSLGICVPSDECYDDPAGCDGDLNAVRVRDCGNACPPTCAVPEPELCPAICILNGCECKPGYILSEQDGVCIEPGECPGGSPCCGANKTYVGCVFGCPTNYCPADDSRAQVACSPPFDCQGGCACNPGYLIVSRDDPRCVLASDCPEVDCTRQNEIWDPKPSSCFLERCDERGKVCDYPYPTGPRCVCKEGYYRNESDICIPASECPPLGCKGDLNATLTRCPTPCPKTCADPNAGSEGCIEVCLPEGCQCNPGYVLTTKDGGICIKPQDCPDCNGDPYAVFSECPTACEPTCAKPDPDQACTFQCLPPGCVCRPGYVLSEEGGKCIKPENCPACNGDPYAVFSECPSACEPTCANPSPEICTLQCLPPGCICKPGYVLSEKGGKCIKPEKCPACNGDPYAVFSECPSACEPTCANPKPEICTLQCLPPGCVCKPGYVLTEKGGTCIKPESCPDQGCNGDRNATYKECPSACPLTCAEQDPNRPCIAMCAPSGCECNPGYVLENGKCIKPEDCPVVDNGCNGDLNATHNDCPSSCPTTCGNRNSKVKLLCPDVCDPSGCECKPGYILTEKGGVCIKPEDCPDVDVGCNGDLNATYSECPSSCPTTCANRFNEGEVLCPAVCDPSFCTCKPGYILTEKGGICIKPEDCPEPGCEGDPNAEHSDCPSACQATCDNPDTNQPCTRQCLPPGCVCKTGFIRIEKEGRCIKPENCPDQGCNGDPNAVYSTCPSACEPTCSNQDPQICTLQCLPPGCVCKPGYVLTDKGGICIKPENCPGLGCDGDLNATYTECRIACPLTCDDQDPNRVCPAVCKPPGCQCNPGYVLNEDGKCILPEDCPGCEGDPNAKYSDCPSACQATCDNPDTNQPCTKQCLPPGCVCKTGFIRIEKEGKCIKPENCPDQGCNGDPNAVYSTCPSACEPTCSNQDPQICTLQCLPPGCVCKPGYVLTEKGGICIKPENCPGLGCDGDLNATYTECRSACPLTCDDQDPNRVCPAVCKPPGCQCNPGYVLNEDGKCILPEDCPGCEGDPNAKYSDCPSACQATCDNPDTNQPCTKQCLPPGCVCKTGFIRIEKEGKCIKPENCPDQGCNGDPNAVYSTCPSACEPTCSNQDPQICTLQCLPPGCVCKPGYVLTDKGGICIKPENCPGLGCNGDLNATYTECRSTCPLTCDDQDPNRVCVAVCKPPGCQCNPGYVLNEDGKCILPEDCPGCEDDPNAKHSDCPGACQATCDNPDTNQPCTDQCLPPGCVCKTGFIRIEKEGKCIKPENCPDQGCNGDPNAVYSTCPSACEPTCSNQDPQICTLQCLPPGCVCKPGYVLSEKDGICVKPENCPDQGCNGDPNAVYSTCPSACEPTCSIQDPQICTLQCLPPGCVCKPGYVLLEKGGICIKPENCPGLGCNGDLNATYTECRSACPRTCGDEDSGRVCPAVCKPPGCQCNPGYVLNEDGKCILPEDCPAELECNGDRNATHSDCPAACPATCRSPDAEGPCIDMCMPPGCVCKPGYLLTKPCGRCIKPEDCPGGSPRCGVNETYVYCKVGCPTNYCPVDDSRDIISCDPMDPCPGGCACKGGYLMISEEDDRCILSSECPPVKCTRDNEVWDPNAPGCLHESCDDKDIPCDFQYPGPPRCVCIEGYYRNQDDVCVPENQCPALGCEGDKNATFSECPSKCPATCCEPDSDRPCITSCAEPGCVCNEGYILSEPGGSCIRPYDCPGGSPHCCDNMTYVSCKIDCPMKYCPESEDEITIICDPVWPCPSGCVCKQGYLMKNTADRTCILAADCPPVECTRPNEVWDPSPSSCNYEKCDEMYYICGDTNPGRPKCVCKDGYYKDQNGVCILAEECPKPQCGYNEVAVPCRQICPPQNCEIAYTDYACTNESKICEPGCDCLPDHLRNGSGICIPNEECPYPSTPVCGINEIARDCRRICPPQTCISKYALFRCAENITCEPGCDCVRNYLRDSNGICIPSEQCPEPCLIPDECKRTCEEPNPPNCEYNPPKVNMKGCDCKEGYILSELGGDCIPIDECPPELTCNGDPNARVKQCPRPCPSTCDAPNQSPCKRMCEPIGCECKPGFLLSNSTGRCILPDQCPGGNPCGKDGRFVDCISDCQRDYCPVDDSRNVTCDPPGMCLSGCICDLNHKKKSREDPTCIVSSDCPPVNCTRPNEEWSPCPSACLAENCEDVNNQPTVCNTLVLNCEPACICKKGFFRNSCGICIPAKDCPP